MVRSPLESLIAEGRDTLSVGEAGRILGLSRSFAYEKVRDGSIPSIRIGRKYLVPVVQLRALLEGTTAGDAA